MLIDCGIKAFRLQALLALRRIRRIYSEKHSVELCELHKFLIVSQDSLFDLLV